MTIDTNKFLNEKFRNLFSLAKGLSGINSQTLASYQEPYNFDIYSSKSAAFLKSMEKGRYLEALRIANYLEKIVYINKSADNPSKIKTEDTSIIHTNFKIIKTTLEKILEPTLNSWNQESFSLYYKHKDAGHLKNLALTVDTVGAYHSLEILMSDNNSINLISNPILPKFAYAKVTNTKGNQYQVDLIQKPSNNIGKEELSTYLLCRYKE